MSTRKRGSWVAPLPPAGKPAGVSHRYAIAGRTAGATRGAAARTGPSPAAPVPPASAAARRAPAGPASAGPVAADPGMVSSGLQARMVERIAQAGVRDAAVLQAMRAIPRHRFVDPGLASRAYEDCALPIGHGQTISQPYIVARMIELMCAGRRPGRVLEIGTGCGYQAAVLGQVAGMVYSIERVKALHELAKSNLRALRLPNVRLHFGDGMLGLPGEAPFDGVIIAAAGLEVPEALLAQMAVGGRLVAPVGAPGRVQRLVLIERTGEMQWKRSEMDGVHFVPLLSGTV